MEKQQDLCMKILRAESEEEVLQIIKNNAGMAKKENWRFIDNRDTNFNIVKNQATTGGKAATELITNMVDAMLTKHCLEKGVDPKGKKAPKTMYDAVDKFVQNMNGGRIVKEDEKWLRNFSKKNLVIGITGRAKGGNPCFTFADNGEGQHPQDFENTFLSLSAKNKSEIPFVQGKYNMGSSGVLSFCGEYWFKLIISKRYDKSGKWGWTLVRKRPISKESEMLVAEYYAPAGVIPEFKKEKEIYPFRTRDKKEYKDFSLGSGAIVKLYDFYTGKGFTGFRGARESFVENLVETILPFRILDFRQTPDLNRGDDRALGVDARPFYGMEFLLCRNKDVNESNSDGTESDTEAGETIDVATQTNSKIGKIAVTAIPLSKIPPPKNWLMKSNNRVFHHVNGQVQYKQTRGFLTQCGFPALKDRAVLLVNASNLTDRAHQAIWKGDREHIIEIAEGELYKDTVKQIIRGSQSLKELNSKIAKETLDSAAKESSKELVEKLIKSDKNLFSLLDGKIPDMPARIRATTRKPFSDYKYSPTYIVIRGKNEFEMDTVRGRQLACKTDAIKDYFMRAENRGDLYFEDDEITKKFDFRRNLNEFGELAVFIKPNADQVVEGEMHKFKIGLKDDAMPMPVYSDKELVITIAKKIPSEKPPPSPSPSPRPPRAGLPRYKLLTKDGREIKENETIKWDDENPPIQNCNEQDGGVVKDLGEKGTMHYINYDNVFFQNHLAAAKQESKKEEIVQKYILGMRIALLGMEYAIHKEKDNDSFDADKTRRLVAKGAAATMMTLTDHLPKSIDIFAGDKGEE